MKIRVGLEDQHLSLSEGVITGPTDISDELKSLNITGLVPTIKRYSNRRSDVTSYNLLIITDNHTLRWCKIIDGELRLLHTLSEDSESISESIHISYDVGHPRSSRKGWRNVDEFNRENVYSITLLQDGRLVLITMNHDGDKIEQELSIPEGVKSIEGGCRKYRGFTDSESIVTVVTQANRILMCRLISPNDMVEVELTEVATIPRLIDVVRMGSFWLSIAIPDVNIPSNCHCSDCDEYDSDCDNELGDVCTYCEQYRTPYYENGTRFSIITLKDDGEAMAELHEYHDVEPPLILGEMEILDENTTTNLHHPIRFTKFLDNNEVLSEDDEIYTISHSHLTGKFEIRLKD